MPAGLLPTWWVNQVSPFNYGLAAAALVALQALASLGFLRMLLVGFGRRWGIVPPLVLYLATAFTVQSAVWWATGVQALPVQVAFFWAMSYQLSVPADPARRRPPWPPRGSCVGLVFYEKTLLVIGALGIVTVAYFTQGTRGSGCAPVWRELPASRSWPTLSLGRRLPGVLRALRTELRPRRGRPYPDRADRGRDGAARLGTGVVRWPPPVAARRRARAPSRSRHPSLLFVVLAWTAFVLFVPRAGPVADGVAAGPAAARASSWSATSSSWWPVGPP